MQNFLAPKWILCAIATLSLLSLASASDHIDGPVTRANAVADITDLYVFQTPGAKDSLTFVLDVYPFVSSTGHFSDKVVYNFILRKAFKSSDQSYFETDAGSELVISCSFVTPNKNANIQITCQSNDPNHRIKGQVSFNQIAPKLVGNTIELFAGRRLDPFFLSKKFANAFMEFKKVKPNGDNILADLNCLSIVMNVRKDLLFPLLQASSKKTATQESATALATALKKKPGSRMVAEVESPLIAVAAESLTADADVPRRIDRVGRPEVTNVSMNMNSAEAGGEIRDDYNADRPFDVPTDHLDRYVARLTQNIGRYDMIDQKQDWSPSQLAQLSIVLANDFLLIDASMDCERSNFFEIERSLIKRVPYHGCGGRDPNDNATNKLYTFYEHGPANPQDISADAQDGLSGPTVSISQNFPYLAPPNNSVFAALKRKIAAIFSP